MRVHSRSIYIYFTRTDLRKTITTTSDTSHMRKIIRIESVRKYIYAATPIADLDYPFPNRGYGCVYDGICKEEQMLICCADICRNPSAIILIRLNLNEKPKASSRESFSFTRERPLSHEIAIFGPFSWRTDASSRCCITCDRFQLSEHVHHFRSRHIPICCRI